MHYFLIRDKLAVLYKQLTTKNTLASISTNRTLNIVVYHYHLANKNYIIYTTHPHTLYNTTVFQTHVQHLSLKHMYNTRL